MAQKQPNILLITTDTSRTDTLKCMGSPFAKSPHLDRLAAEGVLFNQAHTPSPVCMPARCSLMSGLHTPLHGCIENGIDRETTIPFIPDLLAEAGYTNIMCGKAHYGPVPSSFHIQHITRGEKGSDTDDCYGEFINKRGYKRGTSHPNPIPPELCIDAFIVDRTIESIEKARTTGKPFFAFTSLVSPHAPLDPPGDWADLYEGVELPELNYREGEIDEHPVHLRRLIGSESHLPPESRGNLIYDIERSEIEKKRRLYYGSAAYCDAQIGRLIRHLDETGLRENTLVIYTSDHGQQFYDHGFDDKHNFYDESFRIPLILSMPGTLPAGVSREFAIWNDITATILAAGGAHQHHVQGFDLYRPLIAGEPSPRKCAVGTLYKSAALATHRWKLEYYFEEREGRLFDRVSDPGEQQNLYHSESHTKIASGLTRALLGWRSDILDVGFLREHTGGGGPVARRIATHTLKMTGADAEKRLNDAVAPFA